ncbi:hypothetical protein YC2023_116672 [Brassica napus]
MNRPRKKKESSLLHELKKLELLEEGELVDIPELENEDLIEENSMSIIVRCLNPTVHKVGGLVKALPPIWGMEEVVKAVKQEGEAAILASSRRQNKESAERRPITKRTPKGGRISRSEQSPRRAVSTRKRSEAERKGKNVVGSSSQVWQPKSSQSLPTKQVGGSRSTEESSAVPRTRSDSQGPMTKGASSGASHESPSVFNRLRGRQDVHPHSGHSSEKQRSNEK